ncbi:hypothetical protein GDO81_019310 [Engystomops pustulosus]|uniref:Uncharacterized protein n=1 Tax=Engystomops pustulosus TaxID=76066 RepID=A0AAV6ZJB5_ENGPU|nr:hypothetical protein GDO81_019310 [Engystomops pustulosus]
MCGSNWLPKGTLLRSWLTKSRPRLLLFIAGLKRPQVTLMRRKRMKRTKVAKATVSARSPHFPEEVLARPRGDVWSCHQSRRRED